MSIALIAPGRAMMVSHRQPVLWRPFGGATGSSGGAGAGAFSGPFPSAIAGLAGWWDAGTYAGLVDANGNPLPGWNNAVGGLADKSGTGNALSVYSYSGTGIAPQAIPRLNGTPSAPLGGVGRNAVVPPALPGPGYLLPQMDPDSGLKLVSAQFGSGSAWTIYLVWSRPNFVQAGAASQIALVTVAGAILLAADALPGTSQRLMLFPGAAQTVLTSILERRHTHSVIIRNKPGIGIDAWLDGVQVAVAVANPLPSNVAGAVLFLHNGSASGGAQCWFHEGATWTHALSSADITTLLSCATRWARGARKGVQLVVMGQSNAINAYNDGAWHLLAQGIAWHLGALAYNVMAGSSSVNGSAYTMAGGHGVSNAPFTGTVNYPGSFLADPGDGSDPSTWGLGADGLAVQAFLAAQPSIDAADIALLLWPWTETDSTRSYAEKAYYQDSVVRLLSLTRGMLSRSAASLPLLVWNAIPIGVGTNGGIQMVREATANIVAMSGQNVTVGWPQTSDSNPAGGSWNPVTGQFTSPYNGVSADYDHRDATDLLRFGKIAAPVAARAILAATGGDTEASIPAGIPVVGGPAISHVYQAIANTPTLIITVVHDAGTDLIVPLLAATGQGFAVMDGGSAASPGPIISATACVRLSPTQLQITLASAPSNAQSGLLLFYPYGYGNIFRGNAVTDNFASIAKPSGWDIGADLGSAWTLSYPLAATTTPIPVSSTP
jgi:hypothetical protein